MFESIIQTFVLITSKKDNQRQNRSEKTPQSNHQIGCVGQKTKSKLGVDDPPSQQMISDGGVQSETAPQTTNQQSSVETQPSAQPQNTHTASDKVVIERDRLEELQTSTHELRLPNRSLKVPTR